MDRDSRGSWFSCELAGDSSGPPGSHESGELGPLSLALGSARVSSRGFNGEESRR